MSSSRAINLYRSILSDEELNELWEYQTVYYINLKPSRWLDTDMQDLEKQS